MGSVSNKIARFFASPVRNRGISYYYGGRVKELKGSSTHANALVRGSADYDIDIALTANILHLDCTCPYFADRGYCKHIWAVILAADVKGYLKDVDKYPSIILSDIERDDDSPENDEEEEEEDYSGGFRRPQESHQPGSGWKHLLSGISHASQPTGYSEYDKKFKIMYVTDPYDTYQDDGELRVSIFVQQLKKNGEYGKIKSPSYNSDLLSMTEDPVDLQIMGLLKCAKSNSYYYGYDSNVAVPGKVLDMFIPLLCSTGRYYTGDALSGKLEQVSLGSDKAWDFSIEIGKNDKISRYIIHGWLKRDAEQKSPSDISVLIRNGWLISNGRMERVNIGGAYELLKTLKKNGDIRVPYKDKKAFIKQLFNIPFLPPCTMPDELKMEQITGVPVPVISIDKDRLPRYANNVNYSGEVFMEYAGLRIKPENIHSVYHYIDDKKQLLVRNIPKEHEHISALTGLVLKCMQSQYDNELLIQIPENRLADTVTRLAAAGWTVELKGKLVKKSGPLNITVNTNIDWFDVTGKVDFDGNTVELPALLKAIRKNENVIVLSDGSAGFLDDELKAKLKRYAGMGKEEDGAIRFKKNQLCIIDAIFSSESNTRYDEEFSRQIAALRDSTGIHPIDDPAGFLGQLRPYQKEGLGWLQFLRKTGFGGCLADDMGLGKTIQVIALIKLLKSAESDKSARGKPILIVVPKSLIFNWKLEFDRFAPGFKILDHTGVERIKDRAHFEEHDIVLTTYGTLLNDIVHLKDATFRLIVLDEAQAIKNADALTAKAVKLLDGELRLALSGTPVQNHLGELWSLFEFLNPGMLGASSAFGDLKFAGSQQNSGSIDLIRRALRPFILRRTKSQVAKDLPERTEETIFCELDGKQRKLYDELRDHYRMSLLGRIKKDGLNKSKIMVLEALLRLRQAACHPGLIDPAKSNYNSAKLDSLIPSIEEIVEENHKILVFSQFTSFLSIVRKALDSKKLTYEYLDGSTTHRERHVQRFQEDEDCKLFLISLKAGGLGLNLTAAEYVYLLDPWWNPAIEAQAIDRAHRIGQTRNVFAYRLIAKDTVEEKVLELQKSKRQLADSIINEDNSIIRSITMEDIELLLG